jgi:dTDP-4-amino-4,6-dideoxygalactose transaminase
LRGLVHKYTWVDYGSSWLPSDLLAAFLLAQLEAREEIQARRRALWVRYAREFESWAGESGVSLPVVPEHCRQAYHMFYLLMRDGSQRDGLLSHLEERGILAVFHYLPLHQSDMGRRFGGKDGDCPVTESVSGRLVRLPFYTCLTDSEQGEVIEAVRSYRGR